MNVYLYLNDPNHYFQVPYAIIYEIVDGQVFYFSEITFEFTPTHDGKEVTFEVIYPNLDQYEIVIGVRNQMDYKINHIIFEEILGS